MLKVNCGALSSIRLIMEAEKWCEDERSEDKKHLSAFLELRLVSRWTVLGDVHRI
jgi:hypothetical protein